MNAETKRGELMRQRIRKEPKKFWYADGEEITDLKLRKVLAVASHNTVRGRPTTAMSLVSPLEMGDPEDASVRRRAGYLLKRTQGAIKGSEHSLKGIKREKKGNRQV